MASSYYGSQLDADISAKQQSKLSSPSSYQGSQLQKDITPQNKHSGFPYDPATQSQTTQTNPTPVIRTTTTPVNPTVVYSPNPSYVSPIKDSVTVYIDPSGRTTGQTSMLGFSVPAGFNVTEQYQTSKGIMYGRDILREGISLNQIQTTYTYGGGYKSGIDSTSQYSIVSPAPSLWQQYKSTMKEYAPFNFLPSAVGIINNPISVSGNVAFFSNKFAGAFEKEQIQQIRLGNTGAGYQLQASVNAVKMGAEVLPYVAVGGIAGGTAATYAWSMSSAEMLVNPAGAKERAGYQSAIQSVKLPYNLSVPSGLAITASYIPQVANTALATSGFKTSLGEWAMQREMTFLSSPQSKVVALGTRYELGKKGIDSYIFKQEGIETKYYGWASQPYRKTGKGFIMEGGKGEVYSLWDNKIIKTEFNMGGNARLLGKNVNFIKSTGSNQIRNIGVKVKDVLGGGGRVYTEITKQTAYTSQTTYNPFNAKITFRGTELGSEVINSGKVYKTFSGMAGERGDYIYSIAGESKKARMNLDTGKISVLSEAKSYTALKKIKVDSGIEKIYSFNSKKSYTPSDSSDYTKVITQKVINVQIHKPSRLSSSYTPAAFGSVSVSQVKYMSKQVTSLKLVSPISSLSSGYASIEKQKIAFQPSIKSMQSLESVQGTKYSYALMSMTSLKPLQSSQEQYRLATGQITIPATTTEQRTYNPTPLISSPSYAGTPIVNVPFFFIPRTSSGDNGEIPSRVIKGGRKKIGYVPSFSAFAFNISGKYNKKGDLAKSGLDFRPITNKFKIRIKGLGK